jgi:hypothetical protein
MGSARTVVVLEVLPVSQLLLEIHVISIGERRVELILVGPVRPLDLALSGGVRGLM